MNERIKTLAKVAGYDEINKAAMKLIGFDPEKFAELIDQFRLVYTDEQYQRRIDKTILKHFGLYE
jgi:hypothetical protein